jgi:hypothetical protein
MVRIEIRQESMKNMKNEKNIVRLGLWKEN